MDSLTRGDAPHVVRRLPLAFISRAFGAYKATFIKNAPEDNPFGAYKATFIKNAPVDNPFGAYKAMFIKNAPVDNPFGA